MAGDAGRSWTHSIIREVKVRACVYEDGRASNALRWGKREDAEVVLVAGIVAVNVNVGDGAHVGTVNRYTPGKRPGRKRAGKTGRWKLLVK